MPDYSLDNMEVAYVRLAMCHRNGNGLKYVYVIEMMMMMIIFKIMPMQ